MRALFFILISIVTAACATTTPKEEAPQPLSYEDEIRQAANVMAAQTHLVLRYNPVTCGCPAFELQIGSRWVRVALEQLKKPDSAAAKLMSKAISANKKGHVGHYKIKGELDDSLNRCAGRAIYLSVAILEPSPK